MSVLSRSVLWSVKPSFHEWSDFDYTKPVASQRAAIIPPMLVLWIAFVDLCWPHTNFSILYVIPLALLARTSQPGGLRRIVATLVLLTLGIFILKNSIHQGLEAASYLNYRLVNRALVAITIVVVGWVAGKWTRWRAEQSDRELPDHFRWQEQEVSATLAMLICAPLVALIAVVDYFSPANFNLAILYPIPLFIAAWTGSRRLLWSMLAALLLLTVIAHVWGTPAFEHTQQLVLVRNRLLAGFGMLAVTVCLTYWLDADADGVAR